MTTYRLFLESGPRRRKTMVHALDLLGCVVVGPTTDRALEAAPGAIDAYRRFLARIGEPVDLDDPIETTVVEHITEGQFLGSGSPYLVFQPDLEPIGGDEIETLIARAEATRATLAGWAAAQEPVALDAVPADGGWAAGRALLHLLGTFGGYLSAALGGATGFSALEGRVARGELTLPEALLEEAALAAARLRATTDAERAAVVRRPRDVRTLRKAVRRMLEHDWEHLVELARRPGGPEIA